MTGECADFGPFVGLPDFNSTARVGHRDFLIVRVDRDRGDRRRLFGISLDQHPVVNIEQAGDFVLAPRDHAASVKLETERRYGTRVAVKIPQRLLVGIVPQSTGLVRRTGGDHRIVWIYPQRQDRLFVTGCHLDGRPLVGPALHETVGT